jgi:hypothetical protein
VAITGDEEPELVADDHAGAWPPQGRRATGIAGDPHTIGQAERVVLGLAHDRGLQQRPGEGCPGVAEQGALRAAFVLRHEQRELTFAVGHAGGHERFVGGHGRGDTRLATLTADHHDGDGIAARQRSVAARVMLEEGQLVGVHREAVDRLEEHEPARPGGQVLEASEPTERLRIT